MKKICIVSDDSASFKKEELKNKDIFILRMAIIIEGEAYFESQNLNESFFYKKLEENVCSTSQPSLGELISFWDNLLKSYDEIIHIPISSGLSASCQIASNLSKEPQYKNKVFVVNNHRIEPTLKQSVLEAYSLVQKGYEGKEIKEILEKEGPESSIYLMVNTLKYLKKGGRITPAAALIGDALHIKPVLSIYGEKLDAYQKCIGSKKAILTMINAIKNDINIKFKGVPLNELYFTIAHSNALNEAIEFKKEAEKFLNIEISEINSLSFLITTHVGPGVLAITVTKKIDQ